MIFSTDKIIEKGNELNEIYRSYKNSTGIDKELKWMEFLAASDEYRKDVHAYICTNPVDIARCL